MTKQDQKEMLGIIILLIIVTAAAIFISNKITKKLKPEPPKKERFEYKVQ